MQHTKTKWLSNTYTVEWRWIHLKNKISSDSMKRSGMKMKEPTKHPISPTASQRIKQNCKTEICPYNVTFCLLQDLKEKKKSTEFSEMKWEQLVLVQRLNSWKLWLSLSSPELFHLSWQQFEYWPVSGSHPVSQNIKRFVFLLFFFFVW